MDDQRFDDWLRRLRAQPTRRAALRALAGGAIVAGGGRAGTTAAPRACGPCERGRPGRCRSKRDDAPCRGTGRCNPLPRCGVGGELCANVDVCCSGICAPDDECEASALSGRCIAADDCLSRGPCVGYRCRQSPAP